MSGEVPGVARPLLPAYVHSAGFAQVVSCLRHPVNGLYFFAPKRARAGIVPRLLFVLALTPLAAPALAQEPEPPAPSPISASGWCVLTSGSDSDPPADPEAEPVEDDSIGCDFGIAARLFQPLPKRLPRLSVVGALGTETLGAGLGWLIHGTDAGTAYGVALGAVAPWGPEGIDVSEWGLALGATLSLTRARDR